MRRALTLIAATAVVTSLATAVASASASRAKLQLRSTNIGEILVNSRGFTVYAFSKDGRNKDACVKISGCSSTWPPVTTGGKALAGPGVRSSLIGTITLKGGAKQVTYGGHPLYTYIGDSQRGETSYVGFSQFGGHWLAVNAAGFEVIK